MIKIRKSNALDTSQLEQLFLTTRRHTFHWVAPDRFFLGDYRKVTKGESIFIAEEEDGEICGFISVYERERPSFIHHLFVAPIHQRKGIGKLLIKSLFVWLPLPYRLKCLVKNQNAIAFYHRNEWIAVASGWSEEGEYLLLELDNLD